MDTQDTPTTPTTPTASPLRRTRRPAAARAWLSLATALSLAAPSAYAQRATPVVDDERPPDLSREYIPPPPGATPTAAAVHAEAPELPIARRLRWGVSGGFVGGFAFNPWADNHAGPTPFGGLNVSVRVGSQLNLREAVFYESALALWIVPRAGVVGTSWLHTVSYEYADRSGFYLGAGVGLMGTWGVCVACSNAPGFDVSAAVPLRIGTLLPTATSSRARRTALRIGLDVVPTITLSQPSFFVPFLLSFGFESY
jgi:hypothetical protein